MSRYLVILLSFVFTLGTFGQSGTSSPPSKLILEAQTFQKQVTDALKTGDGPALEKMLGEGFMFIHSTGYVEQRDEYIKNASSGRLHAQRVEIREHDVTWHAYAGNTVVRYDVTEMINNAKNATESRMRFVFVFVKVPKKGWQWVSGQSTKLPVRPTPVALDAAVLDRYVGVYTIAPGRTFTVTKENGRLHSMTTGRSPAELIPSSETTFVLFNEDNDPGFMEASFSKADGGKSDEVVLRLNGLQIWRATRDPITH